MRKIGLVLLNLWALPWGLGYTALVAGIYVLGTLFTRSVAWMDFCQTWHGRLILPGLGVKVHMRGHTEKLGTVTAIVMANHRSLLDIPVMTGRIPMIRFVAKRELGRVPFLGWALIRSEHILIDRSDRKGAVHALQEMAGVFGKGRNVMVFVEGTRAPGEKLLPLKKGGFHLAMDTGLPILPISIEGNQVTFPKNAKMFHPGNVTITVHEPIDVSGMKREDIPRLMKQVRTTLLEGLPSAARLEPKSEPKPEREPGPELKFEPKSEPESQPQPEESDS